MNQKQGGPAAPITDVRSKQRQASTLNVEDIPAGQQQQNASGSNQQFAIVTSGGL